MNSENMRRLLHFTNTFSMDDLPVRDSDTGNSTSIIWISRIKKYTKHFLSASILYHIISEIIRTTLLKQRALTFKAWYPYDTTISPYFEITMLLQGILTMAAATHVLLFPPFYATLVCMACSQLEKLREELKNIRQNCSHPQKISRPSNKNDDGAQIDQNIFQEMQQQIIKCIRLHQDVNKYTQILEDVFHILMLEIFFLNMSGLCLAALSFVKRWGDVLYMAQSALIYAIYICEGLSLCWFASELSDQAERVRYAAWDCDWVGAPKSFQNCVQIIIAQAGKEVVLTAGKIVPVSKITLVNMIQESISFFMFLTAMKDINHENYEMGEA